MLPLTSLKMNTAILQCQKMSQSLLSHVHCQIFTYLYVCWSFLISAESSYIHLDSRNGMSNPHRKMSRQDKISKMLCYSLTVLKVSTVLNTINSVCLRLKCLLETVGSKKHVLIVSLTRLEEVVDNCYTMLKALLRKNK